MQIILGTAATSCNQMHLEKLSDLNVEYEGNKIENWSSNGQQKIIEHYIKRRIYHSLFGVGKQGWGHQLKSREKR